jgi:tripartite-type tricarboxylate transporter receptor subunit TctC
MFLHLAAGAVALPAVSRIARAFPTRPVRIVVGFPPGGPSDLLARLIGQSLSDRLGQPFIVENRPGASGNIATEGVTRAPADGHTLLLVVPGNAVSDVLYDNLNFSFMRDTAPVAGISIGALLMEVNPAVPVRTVPEFIAYTKARPGQVNYASPGIGATIHLCGELFNIMAGVKMVHVPYRGNAPALTDLIAGQVQMMFADTPSSIEHVRAGKLRALAVTSPRRSEFLPELPTVGEFLPGFEASNWFGVAAPKNTPAEIVDKLNKEINIALAEPKIKARLADLGAAPLLGSPADFGKFMAAEAARWTKVIRETGIKAK